MKVFSSVFARCFGCSYLVEPGPLGGRQNRTWDVPSHQGASLACLAAFFWPVRGGSCPPVLQLRPEVDRRITV